MSSSANASHHSIAITSQGRTSNLTLTDDSIHIERPGEGEYILLFETRLTRFTYSAFIPAQFKNILVPFRNVVWSELVDGTLEVSVLAKKRKKGPFSLVRFTTHVEESQRDEVSEFVGALQKASYKGAGATPPQSHSSDPSYGRPSAVPPVEGSSEPEQWSCKCCGRMVWYLSPELSSCRGKR